MGITKCENKLLQSVASLIKCNNYFKVRRNKVVYNKLVPIRSTEISQENPF